jgi:hypothetical protein
MRILHTNKRLLGFEPYVAPTGFDRHAQPVDIYDVFERYYRNHRDAKFIYSFTSSIDTLTLNAGSANTSANGVGFTANVAIGLGPITVTTIGEQYVAPVVTIGGAGGVGATASPVLTGQEGTGVTHTGWNLRTEGSGGRAGRVFYETLVAGSITGDGADDAQLAP